MRHTQKNHSNMKKLDVKKLRTLPETQRYHALFYQFREAEHLLASTLPDARKSGKRLKCQVEKLYHEWFGSPMFNVAGCFFPGVMQTA
jgi:hypothetical protein